MNTKNLKRKIRTAAAAFSLLFGIGILTATTANAQYDRRNDNDRRNDRRDDDDRYDNDRDYNNRNNRNSSVLQQAYRYGFSQGVNDARSGRRPNAQRAAGQAMRQMNNGRWGNQRNYRQEYRQAFIRGYQEGYNRSDNRYDRRNNNRNRRNGY
jgi:hypothetical protein